MPFLNCEEMKSSSSLEVRVAKLYLFLLPFRMITPFEFLQDVIGPLANFIDIIFLTFGLVLWILSPGGMRIYSINVPLYRTLRNSILLLNLMSLVMACVMCLQYGDYNGKSPFLAIIPMGLFYFQYLLIFLYNMRVFQLMDYRTIVRIFSRLCVVLLVIGYIQVMAIWGIGAQLYDTFAEIIGGFVPSSKFYKLPLTGSEAAAGGAIMCIFVFPFLIARYLHGNKKSLLQLLLWLLPLYYTRSSTAYLLFVVDMGAFILLLLRQLKETGHLAKLISVVAFACVISFAVVSGSAETGLIEEISYTAFDKAVDIDNGSTASRMVPFVVNWGCFTEMPLIGVGNGLQGYFFFKYFPYEFLNAPGTDLGIFLERASESGSIPNGGTFLLGYFSGYGIIGIVILIIIILKLWKTFKARESMLGVFREMFIIGSCSFLLASVSSEMYCQYYAWFVISIPFMYYANTSANKHNA